MTSCQRTPRGHSRGYHQVSGQVGGGHLHSNSQWERTNRVNCEEMVGVTCGTAPGTDGDSNRKGNLMTNGPKGTEQTKVGKSLKAERDLPNTIQLQQYYTRIIEVFGKGRSSLLALYTVYGTKRDKIANR